MGGPRWRYPVCYPGPASKLQSVAKSGKLGCWQMHGEHRTLARLARHRDVAAHHLAELSADHEAETRAAVLARRLRGRLGELLEQLAHLLLRHADAGIGDRERDPVAA